MLTRERLKEVLHYDPQSGHFTWKTSTARRVSKGDRAGVIGSGYVLIRIDGRLYRAHRLAWYITHGAWPAQRIDHIDRDGTNNAISNLREASVKQNAENSTWRADNSSGYRGVVKRRDCDRWIAQIGHNGKRVYLGIFKTPQDASAAYEFAKKHYFTHSPGE